MFSHIYQSNLSPFTLAGYRARAGRNELAVDNFLPVFFFNDFKARTVESLEKYISRDFLWITYALCGSHGHQSDFGKRDDCCDHRQGSHCEGKGAFVDVVKGNALAQHVAIKICRC